MISTELSRCSGFNFTKKQIVIRATRSEFTILLANYVASVSQLFHSFTIYTWRPCRKIYILMLCRKLDVKWKLRSDSGPKNCMKMKIKSFLMPTCEPSFTAVYCKWICNWTKNGQTMWESRQCCRIICTRLDKYNFHKPIVRFPANYNGKSSARRAM